MDLAWEASEGISIDAISLGGYGLKEVPLTYEVFTWHHWVSVNNFMSSESTAATEYK